MPSHAARSRAELAIQTGDPADALRILAPIQKEMIEVYGPDFFAVWSVREVEGFARARLGDPAGVAELREVYAWYVSQYGADSPGLTRISAWLGDALLASEPREAHRLFEQAYAMQGGAVTTFGGARTALFIAESYVRAGDRTRARPFAREARAFLDDVDAPALLRRAAAAAR